MSAHTSAARRFHVLGDEHRLAIVELLGSSPRSVAQIADVLPISRPAVSRHLRLLKETGIVTDMPVGTRRVYRLRDEALVDLVRDVEAMWGGALARFALLANNPSTTPSDD